MPLAVAAADALAPDALPFSRGGGRRALVDSANHDLVPPGHALVLRCRVGPQDRVVRLEPQVLPGQFLRRCRLHPPHVCLLVRRRLAPRPVMPFGRRLLLLEPFLGDRVPLFPLLPEGGDRSVCRVPRGLLRHLRDLDFLPGSGRVPGAERQWWHGWLVGCRRESCAVRDRTEARAAGLGCLGRHPPGSRRPGWRRAS